MNEKAGHLRNLFFCLLAAIEVASSCFQPQGGMLSSLFAGLRQALPQNGFVAEITSSAFIALALSLPLLLDCADTVNHFRKNVLLRWFPVMASRRYEAPLKLITVGASVGFALVFLRSTILFFTDGLRFARSPLPFLLLYLIYILRFVLLNSPQPDEILKSGGGALVEIGTLEEMGTYMLPPQECSIHIDYQQDQETARIYTGPRSVAKRRNERVILVHPDTVFVSDIKALLQLTYTDIDLRIDVTVTRNPGNIHIAASRLRVGVPDEEAIRAEVKRLVETQVLQKIRQDPLYVELAEYTQSYLQSQVPLVARDITTLEAMIANIERIRQQMQILASDLIRQLAQVEKNETYSLFGQLLYCRIYVDAIGLNAQARQAFERMRDDIRTTLDALGDEQPKRITALATLIDALNDTDLLPVALTPGDLAHLDPTGFLNRVLPARAATGNGPTPEPESSLYLSTMGAFPAPTEPNWNLLSEADQEASDAQTEPLLFGQRL